MSQNMYPHLNSPLKIRNTVFQNRLMVGPGIPIFAQASETYPCDDWLAYYARLARTGVGAMITEGACAEIHNSETENKDKKQSGHQPPVDIMNPINNQHRYADIAEMIKAENAVPACKCMAPPSMHEGYDVSSGVLSEYVEGDGSVPVYGKEAPQELIYRVIDAYADNAAMMKELGFKMVELHFAYRNMFGGRFLSRYTNKRTDEFGGSIENRSRFALLTAQAIKKRCGDDFLVGMAITAVEPKEIYGDDGLTMEETLQFLDILDGYVDVLSIREHQIDFANGPGFRPEALPNRPVYHTIAEHLHKNNMQIKLAYVCGAHDLNDCEDLVASGDADIVLTTRAFISNPDYAVKMHEGRNEDVTPCLRCNRCHHDRDNVWHSFCAVNPTFALEVREEHLVQKNTKPKTVAVIGGGCAGLKFAMDAADQGHQVTIYEKEAELGGQLNLAAIPYIKKYVKKFRDYLVYQVGKRDIRVVLHCEVKPGDLAGRYDKVICAIGSVPVDPVRMPGHELAISFAEALKNPDQVKGDVIVIGGGEVGLETSLHMVKLGHSTLCITDLDKLAPEAPPVHYRRAYRDFWEHQEGFTWSLNTPVTAVKKAGERLEVVYWKDGKEASAFCDTAIMAVGTKSLYDEAIAICAACGSDYRIIGDCVNHGNIATAMRNAYYTARNL